MSKTVQNKRFEFLGKSEGQALSLAVVQFFR